MLNGNSVSRSTKIVVLFIKIFLALTSFVLLIQRIRSSFGTFQTRHVVSVKCLHASDFLETNDLRLTYHSFEIKYHPQDVKQSCI